ncbi:MAG: hypoxanthine-guanine phosphoribosyltransferase [Gammaproteobacteria bacterium]|nr:MAG: hypoxanthine-guanine phosphoribosyltransferase [Gammaproteobacteria bacterium]
MRLENHELEDVLLHSECLITEARIAAAYDKLAATLNLHYTDLNPIIVVVLNGGLIPAGHLLTRLSFAHRMDYIHATRYRNNQGTNELTWKAKTDLEWKAKTDLDLHGEHVLLVDDIFDEGVTLKCIVEALSAMQPASLKTCCLLDKDHDRKVAGFQVDFVGTTVEDRYIYGCGMDYHGYLRHLPGIYALKDS